MTLDDIAIDLQPLADKLAKHQDENNGKDITIDCVATMIFIIMGMAQQANHIERQHLVTSMVMALQKYVMPIMERISRRCAFERTNNMN